MALIPNILENSGLMIPSLGFEGLGPQTDTTFHRRCLSAHPGPGQFASNPNPDTSNTEGTIADYLSVNNPNSASSCLYDTSNNYCSEDIHSTSRNNNSRMKAKNLTIDKLKMTRNQIHISDLNMKTDEQGRNSIDNNNLRMSSVQGDIERLSLKFPDNSNIANYQAITLKNKEFIRPRVIFLYSKNIKLESIEVVDRSRVRGFTLDELQLARH
jgi:hypothetical protein